MFDGRDDWHRGAVIKTIGDAVMAAFLKSADAVEAALEMRKVIEQFNETRAKVGGQYSQRHPRFDP